MSKFCWNFEIGAVRKCAKRLDLEKFEKSLTNFCWNFEIWAVQRIADLVDLEKPCKMTIWLLSWLSIQPRTSPLKFDHFVVKSEKGSISNLSTKPSAAHPAAHGHLHFVDYSWGTLQVPGLPLQDRWLLQTESVAREGRMNAATRRWKLPTSTTYSSASTSARPHITWQ